MLARRLGLILLFTLLPGALLAPVWQNHGLGADEDDTLYYFPSRVFFHESIQAGDPPWLNPWVGVGRPYLADPQSAIFYPTTWLFAVLDPWVAYPLSLWIHYSLALWGAYRLLRSMGRSPFASTFGAIAFAFCGFMLAHRAHFCMQHAAAWTPWVFWRLLRYARSGEAVKLVSAAITAALQLLAGHVQISAITALGLIVYVLAWDGPRLLGVIRLMVAWLAAGGLFAVQAAPTLTYLLLCTRTQRGYMDFVENSWSPISAFGLWLPMFFGQRTPNFFDLRYWGPSHQVEQFAYAGIAPLLLALLAIATGWRHVQRRPWVALLGFSLLLALGLYGPICPFLYWLPGASLFRVPARALLLGQLAIAALSSSALDDLDAHLSPKMARARATLQRWTRQPLWAIGAALLIPILVALGAALFLSGAQRGGALHAARPWATTIWFPAVMLALNVGLLRTIAFQWKSDTWRRTLLVALAVDLGAIGWTIDVPPEPISPTAFYRNGAEWIDTVRDDPGRLWVVTARHDGAPGEYVDSRKKLAANINILKHIASLTDYGPLQPRSLDALLGLKPWGEAPEAERLLADTRWMDALNVRWILLCEAQWPPPEGCDLVAETPAGYRLYRNPCARGEAFFADSTKPGALRTERVGLNGFRVRVGSWGGETAGSQEPSEQMTIVLSTLAIPGWSATIDGEPATVGAVDGLLIGAQVNREARSIEFQYFPPGLIPGAAISLSVATALLILCAFAARSPAGLAPQVRRRARAMRRRRRVL